MELWTENNVGRAVLTLYDVCVLCQRMVGTLSERMVGTLSERMVGTLSERNVFLCGLQISLKISSHRYKREEGVWAHA